MSLFSDSGASQLPQNNIQDIRQAMLDCIRTASNGDESALVSAQVLYAADIQSLWYLRSDVMTLLASLQDEATAHARLAPISEMFDGLLPAAQKCRPNRLRR